jgi:shikimate dehydrogenase
MAIGAATRLFALLGDPIDHSLSPRMQNAALAAARLDGVYVALRCGAADLPGLMAGIARAGGGGNITVPHKAIAAAAVEEATDAVRRTAACNTFWLERGRIRGDNTDVQAVAGVASRLIGSIAGARVLLIGAGGAGAAALCALLDAGAGQIGVVNRSPTRAEEMIRRLDPGRRKASIASAAAIPPGRYDLVINATSLGLRPGDALPLDLSGIDIRAALDLVYRPGGTEWTRHAAALGISACDGREVLLLQGAAAFARWWPVAAPIDAMRSAIGD